MELAEVRQEIDQIDDQLLGLFVRRMELAKDVAAAKRESGRAPYDPARERQKLFEITQAAPEGMKAQAASLFSLLMSMNKAEQLKILHAGEPTSRASLALQSMKPVSEPFPSAATVACQGVEGAYSQLAA